jgi:hypothetical protein
LTRRGPSHACAAGLERRTQKPTCTVGIHSDAHLSELAHRGSENHVHFHWRGPAGRCRGPPGPHGALVGNRNTRSARVHNARTVQAFAEGFLATMGGGALLFGYRIGLIGLSKDFRLPFPSLRRNQLDSRGGRGPISLTVKLLTAMDGRAAEPNAIPCRPPGLRLRSCAAITTSTRLRTFSFCIRTVM